MPDQATPERPSRLHAVLPFTQVPLTSMSRQDAPSIQRVEHREFFGVSTQHCRRFFQEPRTFERSPFFLLLLHISAASSRQRWPTVREHDSSLCQSQRQHANRRSHNYPSYPKSDRWRSQKFTFPSLLMSAGEDLSLPGKSERIAMVKRQRMLPVEELTHGCISTV
jgi:hypothetical protein